MFGNNPKLKPEQGDGSILKIHSIFSTLQGEGPYAGAPSVFIRLSGCNLACTFCDTEFDDYNTYILEDLFTEVIKHAESDGMKRLIVITGGEPLRQPIGPFCQKLVDYGFKVQLESNGLLYRELPSKVEIVCSPKNQGSGYKPIRQDVLQHAIAIKFLISCSMPFYADIAEVGQSEFNIPVYVQPMDEYDPALNLKNQRRALEIAERSNAIFSLQLHKILNIE